MDETLFYVFGIGLVVSAVVLSAIGLRFESFPPTRAALLAVIVYFAGMVAATTTFAVLDARDTQHAREADEAAATPSSENAGGATQATTTTAAPSSTARKTAVKLSAETAAIAYDTKRLAGHAGDVTINFTNPAPIAHDVCLDGPDGQQIGCSETVTQGSTSLSESLKPGDYTFYCSVDGHEAAGMKGTLAIR
ncbi:MAG: plastocyanin/azurin family copper-binding protein [Solirubrobacterales bacterium]